MAATTPLDVGIDVSNAPFDLLDAPQQARLRAATDIAYFRAGERLLEAGKPSASVFVILKGRVLASDDRDGRQQQFAEYEAGELFGAFAAMAGRARHSYGALEDMLCYTIPAALFVAFTQENPRFAAYFHESLAVKRRLLAERDQPSDLAELMLTRIRDALIIAAVEVEPALPIRAAVAAMRAGRTDCVLIRRGSDLGISTRTDLLDALALKGASPEAAVGNYATFPVLTLDEGELLFQALVTMTQRHIHRLVVTRAGKIAGTLGQMEVLSHFSSKSHVISLRLARAETAAELADISHELTGLVRTLFAQGAKMSFLMELISALNARLMGKLFELLVPAAVRERCCLIVLGSEGRREQILKTDQDNALIFADDLDWPEAAAIAAEFSTRLVAMGYPPCPGKVMVSNPDWRRTQSGWIELIGQWTRAPDANAMMCLAILFDAEPIAGNSTLLGPVKERMFALAHDMIALRTFAQPAVSFESPFTLLGGLKGGEEGTDIKKGGVFPIVHGLRVLALQQHIAANNSFERAEALVRAGVLEERFARDLTQALAAMIRIRLQQQLKTARAGEVPSNKVLARDLRRLDRDLLRDALRVAGEFRGWLQSRFALIA
jgi:CBS domain-containing protein